MQQTADGGKLLSPSILSPRKRASPCPARLTPIIKKLLVKNEVKPELLIMCVLDDDLERLDEALKQGGNPNAEDSQGFTPLYLAVSHGFTDCATHLVMNGAAITHPTSKYKSPLEEAINKNRKEILDCFMQRLSEVENSSSSNVPEKRPLKKARVDTNGDVDEDDGLLIPENFFSANNMDPTSSPLAPRLRTEIKGLLSRREQGDAQDDSSLLLMCVLDHDLENLDQCLDNGMDPNAEDSQGFTPLYLAVEHSFEPIAEKLVKAGALLTNRTEKYCSPLELAIKKHNVPLVASFLCRMQVLERKYLTLTFGKTAWRLKVAEDAKLKGKNRKRKREEESGKE